MGSSVGLLAPNQDQDIQDWEDEYSSSASERENQTSGGNPEENAPANELPAEPCSEIRCKPEDPLDECEGEGEGELKKPDGLNENQDIVEGPVPCVDDAKTNPLNELGKQTNVNDLQNEASKRHTTVSPVLSASRSSSSTDKTMKQEITLPINEITVKECSSEELSDEDTCMNHNTVLNGSFHGAMLSYFGRDYKKSIEPKSLKAAAKSWKMLSKSKKIKCIEGFNSKIGCRPLALQKKIRDDCQTIVADAMKIPFCTLNEKYTVSGQQKKETFEPNIHIPEQMDFQKLQVEPSLDSKFISVQRHESGDTITATFIEKVRRSPSPQSKRSKTQYVVEKSSSILEIPSKASEIKLTCDTQTSKLDNQLLIKFTKHEIKTDKSDIKCKDKEKKEPFSITYQVSEKRKLSTTYHLPKHEQSVIEGLTATGYHIDGMDSPRLLFGEEKILGLPSTLWYKIFGYLDLDDLKSFRMVSSEACELVETSLAWAINVCFLLNGNSKSWKYSKTCPEELICSDNTLGWPFIRLKYVTTPFVTENFFPSLQLRKSIRSIDIKNCRLSWRDVLELVCCLPNIEEFSYVVTPDFIRQYDVFINLLGDLDDKYNISAKIKQLKGYKESKKSKSIFKSNSSPTRLKKVMLDGLNLEITNILLAILERTCHSCIQELRIWLCKEFLLILPKRYIQYGSRKKNLRARPLVENNQLTLKILQISFLEQMTPKDEQECLDLLSVCMPAFPIFCRIFSPGYKKLSLNELILQMPCNVPLPSGGSSNILTSTRDWGHPNCDVECQATVSDFCLSQKKLQHFKFSQIDLTSTSLSEVITRRLKQLVSSIPTCKVELGATYCCGDMEAFLPNWDEVKDVLVEINFAYVGKKPLPYNQIFSSTMPVIPTVQKLDFRSEVKRLSSFNLALITSKFPNLTSIRLGDIRIRQDGLENSTKIEDKDFQIIISELPNLTDLVLKANMSQLTDFGLTGISPTACARMLNENSFKRKPGDVIGSPLTNLKYLEVLELHGIGEGITNVTAYLGFKDLICLQELYLFTPTFSRLAKKFLKEKFRLRRGFRMSIQ